MELDHAVGGNGERIITGRVEREEILIHSQGSQVEALRTRIHTPAFVTREPLGFAVQVRPCRKIVVKPGHDRSRRDVSIIGIRADKPPVVGVVAGADVGCAVENQTGGKILTVDAGGGAGGDMRQAVEGDRVGRDDDRRGGLLDPIRDGARGVGVVRIGAREGPGIGGDPGFRPGLSEHEAGAERLAEQADGRSGGGMQQAVVSDCVAADEEAGLGLGDRAEQLRSVENVVRGRRARQGQARHGHRLPLAGIGGGELSDGSADEQRGRRVAEGEAGELNLLAGERGRGAAVVGARLDIETGDREADDDPGEDDVVAVAAVVIDSERLAAVGEKHDAVGPAGEGADDRIGAVVSDDRERVPDGSERGGGVDDEPAPLE